jgi:hypothetical protein
MASCAVELKSSGANLFNMRDQERHSTASPEKLALARQYKFPSLLFATLPPSQGSFTPKLDMSFLSMFGTCSATAVHDENHSHP